MLSAKHGLRSGPSSRLHLQDWNQILGLLFSQTNRLLVGRKIKAACFSVQRHIGQISFIDGECLAYL